MSNTNNDKYADLYLLDLDIEERFKSKKKRDLLKELSAQEIPKEEIRKPKELQDFFTYRIQDLRGTIDKINQEISNRFEMKKEFEKEIDYQISKAAFSLGEFKFWGLGYNTGVDVKRNLLERQLADFRKEKRRTELQCWGDIISLRKDLRKVLEEYNTLLKRKNILK